MPARAALLGDPPASAREAGLRYVRDGEPGLRRVRAGKGFRYLDAEDRPIREPATLARIAAMAIPPAWREVWICADAEGHLQAVGKDARGRRQYRYHPRWRAVRDEAKFDQAVAFGLALPAIRRRVEADLALPGLPRQKVLAVIVRLLDRSLIRIGNPEYARLNGSFGLTTLLERHVAIRGPRIHFSFRGKSGVSQEVEVDDRRLARILRRLVELPGEEVFQYLDEARERHTVCSAEVNAYLREIAGADFSAKDFRTWGASVRALQALRAQPVEGGRGLQGNVVRAIAEVAQALGNSRTLCKKCYVHPDVIQAYLEGRLRPPAKGGARQPEGLSAEEHAALRLLRGQARARRREMLAT
jgi:DNA topoisomerase-1